MQWCLHDHTCPWGQKVKDCPTPCSLDNHHQSSPSIPGLFCVLISMFSLFGQGKILLLFFNKISFHVIIFPFTILLIFLPCMVTHFLLRYLKRKGRKLSLDAVGMLCVASNCCRYFFNLSIDLALEPIVIRSI